MTNVQGGPAQPVYVVGGSVATTPAAAPAEVEVTNFPEVQPVSGPLTDAQLRASAIPVWGPLTDAQIRASALPVSGPLTDAQLRAASVVVIDPIAYYASAAGGRLAFNITTGILSFTLSSEVVLAALINPSGSGKDMILDIGEFGASSNTTFKRYRNSTITPTGAAISGSNMGGGAATSVAQMYVGGAAPTFTRSGGTVSKTAHIAGYQQYFAYIRGRSVLRPGQSLAWTIQGLQVGTFTASVYFEYYELPAAA